MKIAVIGTGITGMSAAWLLSQAHDVTVFEREDRIGGHSNTVDAPLDGGVTPVDTGFIVYNEATYPNLTALFDHIGVPTEASDMSFGVSIDDGRLEYGGGNLAALFAQKRNLFIPSYHGMIRDILRFYREAPALLREDADETITLGDYLAANGYGHRFIHDHLLPMGAAIWSASVADIMAFPAISFVRFFQNHGLLKVSDRPQWRTVSGGSRTYVERLTAGFRDRIRLARPVTAIRRTIGGAIVQDAFGNAESFDHVILATHADQALALLEDPSDAESQVLGAFRYLANRAVLHRDPSLMPRRRGAWASWNYLSNGRQGIDARVCVTYWMNLLQNLDPRHPLFVTLNPITEPRADLHVREFVYDHPQFDTAAIAAQHRIGEIQGGRHTWFCGSYCGYGFHEDGLSSGLAVAEALGVQRPWTVTDASPAGRNATPRPAEKRAAA